MPNKKHRRKKAQQAVKSPTPGSLIYRGVEREEGSQVRVIRYGESSFEELTPGPDAYQQAVGQTLWIHVNGVHDVGIVEQIGKTFNLHNLLLEDILNTEIRPKLEEFDDCIFLALDAISLHADDQSVATSHVALVLKENLIISFQETGPDHFNLIYERLRDAFGFTRTRKADYLFYRFIDILVDEYSEIIEQLEDVSELLEDRTIELADTSNIREIQHLRRQLVHIKRSVNPLKDAINKLYLEGNVLIHESNVHFIRDLYDHLHHIYDSIEAGRDLLLSIMDINYSNISNRANEVMKVLTIVATIFIPLTFAAGIYGMNFEYMPELSWKYGYPMFWGLILALLSLMLYYFRKRKWL